MDSLVGDGFLKEETKGNKLFHKIRQNLRTMVTNRVNAGTLKMLENPDIIASMNWYKQLNSSIESNKTGTEETRKNLSNTAISKYFKWPNIR